jgi:hypothetical protein
MDTIVKGNRWVYKNPEISCSGKLVRRCLLLMADERRSIAVMKRDIRKLALWLEKVCQEGVAIEHKILEWKLAEEKQSAPMPESKAS